MLSDIEQARINKYKIYEDLLSGDHIKAFNIDLKKLFGDDYTSYGEFRYIAVNFAGMLSKLSADMLFEEPPEVRFNDPKIAEWYSNLSIANGLDSQFYESALGSSARGDAVFRIRAENGKCIIEDINPSCYFATYNKANVRAKPTAQSIFTDWKVKDITGTETEYRLVEEHTVGKIEYKLFKKEKEWISITDPISLEVITGIKNPVVLTLIDAPLLVHVKNYGSNLGFYGVSDYADLLSIFFAINNRFSRVDNILDRHSDPILSVPEGILDGNGSVKRRDMGVVEASKEGDKPEYIVWDAKLEATFLELDRLVETFFIVSETSRSAFGLGEGQVESGRALKFKLLRTIAKKHRKQLYYDTAIKVLLLTAQKFCKANQLKTGGTLFTFDPEMPTLLWRDGILNDQLEEIEIQERKLASGLTTKGSAIVALDGGTMEEATTLLEQIKEEEKNNVPTFDVKPKI